MQREEENTNEKAKQLLEDFNNLDVKPEEVVDVLSTLIYSIGHHLTKDPPQTSEQVLLRYAEQPTLGTALMAQALFMKETWSRKEEKESYDKIVQGKTKRRKVAPTV